MSKITKKQQPATRPPVDALQYEKLALSAHNLCDRQLDQLRRLATLAASIRRSPSLTRAERQSQKALLELLVETAEGYEQEVECDRELYQVIALNAKGVPHSRITARCAAKLLSEAAEVEVGNERSAKLAGAGRHTSMHVKVPLCDKADARPETVAH
ncbi:hypothetical protein PQQ51_26030 [Paraburkholderia xenovorans]|uniref:hypothetical protein n=1 Tax=Paraburkholderia xenovorans TaxID=36873 RepID=UPI0038B98BBF